MESFSSSPAAGAGAAPASASEAAAHGGVISNGAGVGGVNLKLFESLNLFLFLEFLDLQCYNTRVINDD